jgi:dihydrofolate reductase
MRRIIAAAMTSVDGIMQAPGGPHEDPVGGFKFGGWVAPHFDAQVGESVGEMFARPFDLLLGRKTYDIFAAHWPHVGADHPIGSLFDRVTKYVATRNPDLKLSWQNSQALGPDVVAAIRQLKSEAGPDLLTQGSSDLLQTLFRNDLIDAIHLSVFPVVLGSGKRLFGDGISPGTLQLVSSRVSGSGVTLNRYIRVGPVTTGSFQLDPTTEAELRRRRDLT